MGATNFSFDEARHLYLDANSVPVPSVTQMLKAGGLVNFDHIPRGVLERKRQLGSLVHKAIDLFSRGENLDDYDIPAEVWPYFDGHVNFRNDTGFTPELSEHRLLADYYSMPYGMTLDAQGMIDGEDNIIEYKCGSTVDPAWGVQMAAYDLGVSEKKQPTRYRTAVQLGPNFPRNYKLFPFLENSDYHVWASLLAIATWKQNCNKFIFEDVPERLVA